MRLIQPEKRKTLEQKKEKLDRSYRRVVSKKLIEEDVPRKMEKATESSQEKRLGKKKTANAHVTALITALRSILYTEECFLHSSVMPLALCGSVI